MSQYISYIYYKTDPTDQHWLQILNGEDGVEVYNEIYSTINYSTDGNSIAVDQNGNTYIVGFYDDKIRKMDSAGNVLVEISYDHPGQIAISPGGSLYLYEYDTDGYYVRKRSLMTLEILDEFLVDGYDGDFWGMAFDSDGFLYMYDHVNDRLEKWNVTTKTRVGTCDFSGLPGYFWGSTCSIGIVGTKILLVAWANTYRFYETDTSLTAVTYYNSDLFPDEDSETLSITSLGNEYFILLGSSTEYADRDLYKLNPDLSIVWQVVVEIVELSLGAYSYNAVTYDYPLYPVIFPLRT